MMKKILFLIIISMFLPTVLESASTDIIFRDKKAYGAIPGQSLNVSIGFLSGLDLTNLTDYLEGRYATSPWVFEKFSEVNSSPYMQVGYDRRIAPLFFINTKLNFSYIKTESNGKYVIEEPGNNILLDMNRKLKVYLFNLDFGLKHYFSKPKPQTVCPYVSGGFSAVLPLVRLNTDSYISGTDTLFSIPEETVSKNSLSVGAHAEFGLNFFITNRFSAGLEARLQTCQSDFEIRNANFDLKYAGFGIAFIVSNYF